MVQLTAKAHGKALLIQGDTRPCKDFLKSLGGKWAGGLSGWIFPGTKHADIVEKLRGASHMVQDSFSNGAADAAGAAASAPAAKRQKVEKAADKAGGEEAAAASEDFFVPLTNKRRITVVSDGGKTSIDIREYWGDAADLKPGKKGIRLSTEDWEALKEAIPRIDEQMASSS
mmetsp:Transcript_110566/g.276912  ORF Transcript_110566/g.276912 Transcript_110566/m.276912 type:complete len:172 (+) Transcript_110566:146-661(+)